VAQALLFVLPPSKLKVKSSVDVAVEIDHTDQTKS
jgi:hypothetical protein